MNLSDWFLTAEERGNSATVLDRRHPSGEAWTAGNEVRPLVHGASYFSELLVSVRSLQPGDLLLFTDWRGDPDELLDGAGTEVSRVLCDAAAARVVVRGLVWRSHLDRLRFSERENRHLGEDINAAGGIRLLDMRGRPGGSHHQKFVVLRHPGRPELDVAYVGGIDLCHSRRDDPEHLGDHQPQPMAAVYSERPPWHDIQVAIRGRPSVTSRRCSASDGTTRHLFPAIPCTASETGSNVSTRRPAGSPTSCQTRPPGAEAPFSCCEPIPPDAAATPSPLRGSEALLAASTKRSLGRHLVYLEDQYLWSRDVAARFCTALQAQPDLLLIAVIPLHPDQGGRFAQPPNLVGRSQSLSMLQRAGPAATESRCMASRTTRAHPCTSTPRSA